MDLSYPLIVFNVMNYERQLMALTVPGKTGHSWVVMKQTSASIDVLHLFPGGNEIINVPKKQFKQLISRNQLETVVKRIPIEEWKAFEMAYTLKSDVENLDKVE